MKRFLIVFFAFASALVAAQEAYRPSDAFTVYGYVRNRTIASFTYGESPETRTGDALSARLKADWEPSERLAFHMEIESQGKYGAENLYALYDYYGIPSPLSAAMYALSGVSMSDSDLYPYRDFHWGFLVDHAYGRANSGAFDLSFGKLPIAWGTAYVFNPTAKTFPATGLGSTSEETPGVLALAPSLALGRNVSIQGYLAFQERSLRYGTSIEESDPANLPFGAKIVTVIGSFDLSASFFREIAYYETLSGSESFRRRAYVGADFAGSVGDVGVYGEAALGLPANVACGTGPSDFDIGRDLELSAGFNWTVPGIGVDLRGEYYYRGSGAGDAAGYDVEEILNGTSFVLGKHYIFLYASKTVTDYWTPTLSALTNVADGSWILSSELVWDAASDLEVSIGVGVPFGPAGSEFEGKYDLSSYGLGIVDLIDPTIRASIKMSF